MKQMVQDGHYPEYLEPDVPFCFIWLFNRFLELRSHSGESITWTEIESYGNIRNVKFTQFELDYIFKMSNWTNEEIEELRKQE